MTTTTKATGGLSDQPAMPTIGVIATLVDYAVLGPALAGDARTLILDQRSAIAAVRDGSVDLLIVAPRHDWWAERGSFAELEAAASRAHLLVMAMVPHGDPAALAAAFDAGVADCVAYPFDVAEVAVRVRALLRRKAGDDRRRLAAAEDRHLALTDPVTGVWNRHYLDRDLAAKIGVAQANGRPLSLLMIDIDRFKSINDRDGHAIGDQVLRTVATRLAGGIRGADTLARFGGDELALIMPDTALDVAAGVAERLRAVVAAETTVPFAITVSIGVAELAFDEPAAVLVAKADKALYAAKLEGRNRIAVAA